MSRSTGIPRPRTEPSLPANPDGVDTPLPAPTIGGGEDRPTSGPRTVPASDAEREKTVRASDAEREETVRVLHDALGQGRLDLTETETRVAAAYAAVMRSDLPPLLADLPRRDPGSWPESGAPNWQTLWIGLVWRARSSLWDQARTDPLRPPNRAEQRLALLVLALSGLWLIIWTVIGAAV